MEKVCFDLLCLCALYFSEHSTPPCTVDNVYAMELLPVDTVICVSGTKALKNNSDLSAKSKLHTSICQSLPT